MPSLPDAKLRKVVRHAMQMGPDERRVWLLVEFEDASQALMGPFDRDALIGMVATFGTRYAGVEVAMYVDPDSDGLRIAFDGFTDDQVIDGGVAAE